MADNENPKQRDGSFSVVDFKGSTEDLPALLEDAAAWIRVHAEYVVDQIYISSTEIDFPVDIVVSIVAYEIRPGDVMQALESTGNHETAAEIGALVREHGVREGLRRAGFAYH